MDPIRFVETHGVVLEAGQGVRPNMAEAIAGKPIRGSWWGHKKGRATNNGATKERSFLPSR
jgi:hypothetical protein